MSEENYRCGYKVGPFYRKFVSGDSVWCEVNRDGRGVVIDCEILLSSC
jgi:hypothetical protein